MQVTNLNARVEERMTHASAASSGRGAVTLYGGRGCVLRQTLIALRGGQELSEHENPGEATVLVLRGQVRMSSHDGSVDAGSGDLLTVPQARHTLTALEDAAVLLSVAAQPASEGS